MAHIIDLDFYRKFRVILPVHSPTFRGNKPYEDAQNELNPYHRRRRPSSRLSSKIKNKEDNIPV